MCIGKGLTRKTGSLTGLFICLRDKTANVSLAAGRFLDLGNLTGGLGENLSAH